MGRSRPIAEIDELRGRLRAAGLRVTGPRVAVLRQLRAARAPATHATLVEALAPEGWDRATIFRVLSDLVDARLAHRTDVGDHVWRFELCAEEHPHAGPEHPHFVCNACGDVTCLPEASVRIRAPGGPRALKRAGLDVQIKGRCDRCS
jgi:Fur family ferric uptake transcriptional regulator